MDAVSERRSAALADPVATPLRQEVVVGAVPQGFADGDPGSSQRARMEQMVGATRARSMTVLKHHVDRARAHLFGGGEDVHVRQRRGRGLLQEHRAARLEQLDGDLGVIPGGRSDGYEIRLRVRGAHGRIRMPSSRNAQRMRGTSWVDVDYADQLDVFVVLVAEGMRTSDRATSDDPDTERFLVSRSVHLANPIIVALCWARIASRITSKVCLCGQAVSVRLITSCTRSG